MFRQFVHDCFQYLFCFLTVLKKKRYTLQLQCALLLCIKSVIISEQLALQLYKIIRSASAVRKFKYKKVARQRTVDTLERPVLHPLAEFYGDRSYCFRVLRSFLEKSKNSPDDCALWHNFVLVGNKTDNNIVILCRYEYTIRL